MIIQDKGKRRKQGASKQGARHGASQAKAMAQDARHGARRKQAKQAKAMAQDGHEKGAPFTARL